MTAVRLLVGTRKGAFVLASDETRQDWTIDGPQLKGWEVSDLLLDRRTKPQLLAGVGHFVYGPTIHRSLDDGETWEQVEGTPAYPEGADRELNQVWCIEPGRVDDPAVLYAGVDEASLFISRDGGDHWEELPGLAEHETRSRWFPGQGGLCCHSIVTDPDDPDRLWVGVSAVGVFYTDDGGASFELRNDGLDIAAPDGEHEQLGSCVHALRRDVAGDLYQQNHMGVYRSTDDGETWVRIDDVLPSTFGFPLVTHPRDPGTIYTLPLESDEYRLAIDGQPAVYRSTDRGDSWERLDHGFPADSWVTVLRQAMAIDTLDPAGVYVGTTGGRLFYSADGGDDWDALDCHLPRIQSVRAYVV